MAKPSLLLSRCCRIAVFIPTAIVRTPQSSGPASEKCLAGNLEMWWCNYQPTAAADSILVPDAEETVVALTHTIATSTHITATSRGSDGYLIGHDGSIVNHCDAYAVAGLPCANTTVLSSGGVDFIPLRVLLYAAGVATLDSTAGSRYYPNDAIRTTGGVIVMSIIYSNFARGRDRLPIGTGSYSPSTVIYGYQVQYVRDSTFQQVITLPDTATGVSLEIPSMLRTVYNRTGIRVVVSQTSMVGKPDVQTFLQTAVVALGLLSIAGTIVSFLALSVCPLRALNAQLVTRPSLRMTDFRDAQDWAVLQKIAADPYLVNPLPPVLQVCSHWRRRIARMRMAWRTCAWQWACAWQVLFCPPAVLTYCRCLCSACRSWWKPRTLALRSGAHEQLLHCPARSHTPTVTSPSRQPSLAPQSGERIRVQLFQRLTGRCLSPRPLMRMALASSPCGCPAEADRCRQVRHQ